MNQEAKVRDDLGGPMSIKFKQGKSFNDFCTQYIPDYNPDRFEVLAVRFYYGNENVITLYAIDKHRQEGNISEGKIPVKKFKLNANFANELLPFIEECNFTLTTGNYPLESMEIINK